MKASLLLAPLLILSVACGQKASSNKKLNKIFVKGDPLTMVKGTDKDVNSFVTAENVSSFSDYSLANVYVFAQKEDMPEETEEIESGNEAEETDLTTQGGSAFNMVMKGPQEYSFQDAKASLALNMELEDHRFEVKSITMGKSKFPATVEHYSVSPDKSKMSFLLRLNTSGDGNVLFSLTFNKVTPKQTIAKVSDSYKYIYGPGVKVPWKLDSTRSITIDVCPSVTEHLSFSQVKAALEVWEQPFALLTNKLDIIVKQATSCRPFSDVNQHAIHHVSSYLTMPDKDAYNPGFTMIQADLNAGNIFDADIVILGSEIAKDPNYSYQDYNRMITHEFGHFLGLDHQFNGSVSVMSYDHTTMNLGYYDKRVITELYQ